MALLALVPTAARAQDASQTDPPAGSPSDQVYGIPLQEARQLAAPKGAPEGAIRSDTGVGSSTRVPNAGAARRGEPSAERPALDVSTSAPAPSTVATAVLLALTLVIAAVAGGVAARHGGRGTA